MIHHISLLSFIITFNPVSIKPPLFVDTFLHLSKFSRLDKCLPTRFASSAHLAPTSVSSSQA